MTFWKPGIFVKKRVYADAAAGTPLSARAKKELVRLLELYGNAGGLHKEGVAAKQEIERARKTVAAAIGAHDYEIIFTGSGTEANNLALHNVRGHVVTTTIEHSSVLEPLRHSGARVTEVGVNKEGIVDIEEIKKALTPQTTLVSVQMVNSEIGTIQPIREIAKLLRRQNKKILFHTDASQAPLWLKVGVEQLGVDLLTLDAQKILGPKGVGALYARRGTDLEPLIYGGGQESGFRSGTENTPLIGAFAAALEDAQSVVEEHTQKVAEVRDYCFAEIKKLIPDTLINGVQAIGGEKEGKTWPSGPERTLFPANRVSNNLNISIPDLEAQMAVIALDAEGIAASTRSACDSGDEEPSHVIQALGVPRDLARTAIRISFLPDVTKSDASFIAKTLAEIAQRYKKVL